MKQILITQDIKSMAKEYADNLFEEKTGAFVQPIEGLNNLRIDILELNSSLANKSCFARYLEKLIIDFEDLKQLLPSRFEECKKDFDKLLPPSFLSTVIECRKGRLPNNRTERATLPVHKVKFYEEIVARMHYIDARPIMASYMERIGIQTCVYCNNAEAAYSDEKEEAYYHFDHWKPKDQYPFLSICFFNLYPSCSNCNGHKLDGRKGSFQLYTESEPAKDPFVFWVDRSAYIAQRPDTLKVNLNPRESRDAEYCKEYDSVYRIKVFYNSPGGLRQVSKLITDIDKHRGSYMEAINSSIPGIVDKEELFHDVLGVDSDESNIYTDIKKKLKLDTAKDTKLL